MLIDPFTVIAQIVNFAILAVALKYLLYDRVIGAMDRREAAIAARVHEAERREAAAAAEAEEYHELIERFEHERRELVREARDDARRHHDQLLDDARADVEDERRRWQRGLRAERDELHHQLRRRAAGEVMSVSRRTVADLADADLEQLVIRQGLDHLAAADAVRAALAEDTDGRSTLTVRTAFALDDDHRRAVEDRLRAMGLDDDRAVHFELDPELVLGIELQGDGRTVSWNVADYLDRLGETVDEAIETAGDDDG